MGFDGAFDDRKSEAGAFDFALGVVFFHPIEAAEDMGQVGAGDADAIVGDPGADEVVLFLAADFHVQAGVGILFEGVFDQVEQHLGPVEAVAVQLEFGVRHEYLDMRFLAADDRLQAFEHVLDAGAEAEGFDLQSAGLAGLQAGDDQHVLDDARDAVGVFAHDGKEMASGRRIIEQSLIQQVFEVTADDGHGGAEFVGRVGHEVLADLFRLVFGSDVAQDDAGERRRSGRGGEAGGIDEPGVGAAVFKVAAG